MRMNKIARLKIMNMSSSKKPKEQSKLSAECTKSSKLTFWNFHIFLSYPEKLSLPDKNTIYFMTYNLTTQKSCVVFFIF